MINAHFAAAVPNLCIMEIDIDRLFGLGGPNLSRRR